MGQMGPKLILGTLTMSGDDFPGWSSGAQMAFTMLLATSIGDTVTQCTPHERGVDNTVTVGKIDKRYKIRWSYITILGLKPKFQINWTTL